MAGSNARNSDDKPYARWALWLIFGAAIFRILYFLAFPIQPLGDEAYYWDWGRRLDIGYYSKPPMIAWIYAAADWIGNGTIFGIRLLPVIFGTASLFLLHRLARALFGEKTAFLALLLALAVPAFSVLNLFLTIDAPLVMLWTGALLSFWRWTETRSAKWLVVLCLCLGLGHLTKQMMLVFPILAALFLAISPEKRHLLKSAGLWICVLLSLAFLTPPLVWNAQNDWITFTHTSHHFESNADEIQKPFYVRYPLNFATYFGTQLGVLSPLIFVFLLVAVFTSVKKISSLDSPRKFLIVFAGFPIMAMLLMSFRQVMQPNWAAVYYVSGIVLVAGWLATANIRGWQKWALIVGFVMSAAVYVMPPIAKAAGFPGHKTFDPVTRRTLVFKELAAEFDAIRKRENFQEGKTFFVGLGHRDVASELAFHLPDQPRVYRWEKIDQIASQYEIWPDPAEDGKLGWDALIVRHDLDYLLNRFQSGFESTERLGEITIEVGKVKKSYYFYRGKNLLRWPAGKPIDTE